MYRKLGVLEPLVIFGFLMLYIWKLRALHPGLWVAILGLMLLSHLVHREGYVRLGFGLRNLRNLLIEVGPQLTLMALVIPVYGVLMHTIRPIHFWGAVLALAAYLPWGLLQQYILNGYFLNRFDAVFTLRVASLTVATLFCIVHIPNWFLMSITFVGGYWSTHVYRQHRCLYVLGLAHGVIGFLIFLVVPDSITHHLRVGPGWFRW